jgi:membrane protease YdiL (CAAX protease family)
MKKLIIGLLIAGTFWFMMFATFTPLTSSIHYNYFWIGMSIAATTLILYSLINNKGRLKEMFSFEWKFLWIGLIHAVLLYALSRFGIWLFTNFFDSTVPQILAVYQTRLQAPFWLIGFLLVFLIGPAEEIFWRGFVQDRLMIKFGVKQGTAIAIFFYTFVHIWAFNPMLLLAAFVVGLHWSIMYSKFKSLIPGIISHSVWDLLIFVVLPVTF